MIWGSFVTSKLEPADLDYSVIVSVDHRHVEVAPQHRRFFVAAEARQFYGVDRNYLDIFDYPVDYYAEKLLFFCSSRNGVQRGTVEISLWGEYGRDTP